MLRRPYTEQFTRMEIRSCPSPATPCRGRAAGNEYQAPLLGAALHFLTEIFDNPGKFIG